jgi:small subunit ribosomal protein S6
MKSYECFLILSSALGPEQLKDLQKKIEDAVKKDKGKVLNKIDLGRRQLGYEVRKHRDGYVTVLDLEMSADKVAPLRNMLELNEDVLKYMLTIKLAGAETKPAAAKPAVQEVPVARESAGSRG